MIRKVFALLFFTIGLASLLLLSCERNKKSVFKTENRIEFDTINLTKTHFLNNNPDYPSCNLTLRLIYPIKSPNFDISTLQKIFINSFLGNSSENLSIEETVAKYAENYVSNYRKDAEIYKTSKPSVSDFDETFDDLFHEGGEHANLPEIFYSYYEEISDTIIYNHYGILAFQVKQTNNKGGKVSHENIKNYVIDLAKGELISESDIFQAGYDTALRPILQNSLFEQNSVKNIGELEDMGFFGIEEIIPNKNFLITDKGVIFTYNKGEYSAYQLPASELFIPYSSIRSLLRENSIASKLYNLK